MRTSVSRAAAVALAVALLGGFAHEAAARGHVHGRVGVYIGAPVVVGGYWPYRYYGYPYGYPYGYSYGYYPPAVVTSPPVYIEQAPQAVPAPQAGGPAAPAASYWYYCKAPDGYYPYVKECPGGWQAVAPQPSR